MKGRTLTIGVVFIALIAVFLFMNSRQGTVTVEGQQTHAPGTGLAAVPGLKGGQDVFGPYDPVQNWPRPLAESLPDHKGWTWSQATDVFAESPDRVIVAQKGELPELPSVSDLWSTADWHEREVYDLSGVYFTGHPNLRRILCPEDWVGHPLRKDYEMPLEYHGIRGR